MVGIDARREAVDRHAGNALQRFGDRTVGQRADILGSDRVDNGVSVALNGLRVGQRLAKTGDNDVIAARIIGQKEGDFDPADFTDRYDDALREMIKAKQKGGKGVVEAPEPDDTNVIDLMAALRASLQGSASGGAAKKPAKKTATKSSTSEKAEPKKPAAKKAPAKKTAAAKKAA